MRFHLRATTRAQGSRGSYLQF